MANAVMYRRGLRPGRQLWLLLALSWIASTAQGEEVQYGPWEVFSAEYIVAPVPYLAGQKIQPVILRMPDGTEYVRSLRPIPAEYMLVGRMVRVEGRRILGQGPVGGSLGPFFDVDRIEPAVQSGQSPRVVEALPAPPLVEQLHGGPGVRGRWLMLLGVLESVNEQGAEFRLRSGQVLTVHGIPAADREVVWLPMLAEDATLVGRLEVRSGRLVVSPGVALCAGRAPRCGMLPGQPQGGVQARRPVAPQKVKGPRRRPTSPRGAGIVRPKAPVRPSPYRGR